MLRQIGWRLPGRRDLSQFEDLNGLVGLRVLVVGVGDENRDEGQVGILRAAEEPGMG